MERKTLIYKTGVEYGDYTLNHVQGCSHGCKYPCYAFMMAKRFGKEKIAVMHGGLPAVDEEAEAEESVSENTEEAAEVTEEEEKTEETEKSKKKGFFSKFFRGDK